MINLKTEFPNFTFFKVMGNWNGKFSWRPPEPDNVNTRLVASLEPSLSIFSLLPFLCNSVSLMSIDPWDFMKHGHMEYHFNSTGLLFAEAGQIYNKKKIRSIKRRLFNSTTFST